jgi:hypothetical protein
MAALLTLLPNSVLNAGAVQKAKQLLGHQNQTRLTFPRLPALSAK